MIEKTVGLARNLLTKRKEIVQFVKQIALAEDAIIILHTNNKFSVLGHTSDDAMTVYMLGTATGLSYADAKRRDPDLTVDGYLHQPTSVAFKHIERAGLL